MSAGPVVVVDAGSSLQPQSSTDDPGERAQRRAKASVILGALASADAVALSARDWDLGVDWVRAEIDKTGAAVLAANLVCGAERPFDGAKVVERGGRRIGIVGITDGEIAGCTLEDAQSSLARAMSEAGPVDAWLALIPLEHPDRINAAIGQGLPLAAVIDARGAYPEAGPVRAGDAWSFGAGNRGKAVGRLDLVFVEGASSWAPVGSDEALTQRADRLRERLASLRARSAETAADDPRAAALRQQISKVEAELSDAERVAASVVAADAVNQLRASATQLSADVPDHAGLAANVDALKAEQTAGLGALPLRRTVDAASSPYAGSDRCASCHADETAQWASTSHAHAYQTLAVDNHAADGACVGCHVTGYGAAGGPSSPLDVSGFVDVQCEACHGPARAHADAAAAGAVSPPVVRDPPVEVCRACHDNERDEGRFDMATYRPRVVHAAAEKAATTP
jgi:hypothetical protein